MDLVEKLRRAAESGKFNKKLLLEAADAIEAGQEETAQLQKALAKESGRVQRLRETALDAYAPKKRTTKGKIRA